MEKTKIFNNRKINWYFFSFKIVLFYNLIGIILLILNCKSISLLYISTYTFIAIGKMLMIYFTHIKNIKYENGYLTIYYNHKKFQDNMYNFNIKEKEKVMGINIKYKQLILENKKFKKKFKLDSDEWPDYKEIKEFFIEKKLLEDVKNEKVFV